MEPAAELTIRPVHPSDLNAVADLQAVSIMALGPAQYDADQCAAWARLGREYRHHLLGEGDFWVAECDRRIVGVGGWSPDGRERDLGWIRHVFVAPDAVRQGIGRRIMARAESAAAADGRARLHVWSSLIAAGFYRTLGYRPVRHGRWPLQTGIEIEFVLMTKPWAGPSDVERGAPAAR